MPRRRKRMAEEQFEEVGPIHGLTPYLTVKGGKEAVAFYESAFNAVALFCNMAQDGKRVMHAHLSINGGSLMLSDDFPEFTGGMKPPASVTLHLQVEDADAWWDRAVGAGCTVKMPLDDQFWGDRYGQLQDPFGHSWSIGGPKKG
jgi:PhnB protein